MKCGEALMKRIGLPGFRVSRAAVAVFSRLAGKAEAIRGRGKAPDMADGSGQTANAAIDGAVNETVGSRTCRKAAEDKWTGRCLKAPLDGLKPDRCRRTRESEVRRRPCPPEVRGQP